MSLSKFLVVISLVILSTSVFARKPAVEDFIGVETESYREVPVESQVTFDFGQKVSKNSIQLDTPISEMNIFSILTLLAFACLPVLMWFSLTQTSPKNAQATTTIAHNEEQAETENVESLADYRKSEAVEDKSKKAS